MRCFGIFSYYIRRLYKDYERNSVRYSSLKENINV